MNVAIYTFDLFRGREHLMPWRTVIEAAKYFTKQHAVNCIILNGSDDLSENERFFEEIKIITIDKSFTALANYVETKNIKVLYYPVSMREGLKDIERFKELEIKKIAYFPGGIYNTKGIVSLWKIADFKTAKPYLLEKTIPKYLLLNKLHNSGFSALITMCKYTAQKLQSKKWHNNLVALPGNDDFPLLDTDNSVLRKYNLQDTKFFLFTGSPAPIRGSIHLLRAFEKHASKHSNAKLVMLLRKDVNLDSTVFNKALKKIKNKNQIIVVNEKLTREQLKDFFTKAYAIVLPFLLIPSEIPLTFFEVLSCGTPIITFKNGGTYEYIKECSLGVKSRSIYSLAKAMNVLWYDEALRKHLSAKAKNLIINHPTWEMMSKTWFEAIDYEVHCNKWY